VSGARLITRVAQVAVIEAARSLLGWNDANSEEFNQATTHPVVIFMPEGVIHFPEALCLTVTGAHPRYLGALSEG
jgi:CTP synthase (UTP-ammonia lyase)